MYRTSRSRFWRYFGRFLWENYRLLIFLALFLIGVIAGCSTFVGISAEQQQQLAGILHITAIVPSFTGFLSAVAASAVLLLLLLGVLLLAGLSVCGIPLIGVVPILYGLGIGMFEGYYYGCADGLIPMAILVVPAALAGVWTLMMACSEALRMSLRLAGQMLPSPKLTGGLWNELKLYGIRFLIFTLLAFAAAVLQVGIRWVYF